MVSVPEVSDVRALPVSLTTVVAEEHVDANGHLNVRHHMALHDDGGWAFYADLGYSAEEIEAERRNFFDLEHHVRYLNEARLGEQVAVHHRLLGRTDKALHVMSYLVNESTGELASTLELVTLLVDLDTRRPTALDTSAAAAIDTRLAADRALGWDAGAGGALGLR
ncbi:acyl-CoA thioesterase [Nocardioides sp. GXZ039]|uniref:acyl-CoA thioesterase n=1 Tax=Nocardioides sp. GXZ039 TaxID=3136018 RepID=UPI0030F3CB11